MFSLMSHPGKIFFVFVERVFTARDVIEVNQRMEVGVVCVSQWVCFHGRNWSMVLETHRLNSPVRLDSFWVSHCRVDLLLSVQPVFIQGMSSAFGS